ncbi:hypothetical protein SAMN06295967_10774 [Belliella buryatensis]|uniref:Uncharacterized protein n=2 Tax=Belliella buryatensis TaxID=1500549 RepID=A0A239DJG6_9BACT|nr:hypothetical protein SAMN06295967_10774 [Belliella buryatensis]
MLLINTLKIGPSMYSLEHNPPKKQLINQKPSPDEYRSVALFDLEFQLRFDSVKILFPKLNEDEVEDLVTKMMRLEGWDYDSDNDLYFRIQRLSE